MIVVNSVLVENVEISSASEAMMEARRNTANTAPCSDQFGPLASVSDRSDSIASCVQPMARAISCCCSTTIVVRMCSTAIISDVHQRQRDEDEQQHAEQLAGEIIDARHRLREDRVKRPVLNVLRQQQRRGHD